MGTLAQPQLCTFSYRKALFWPQNRHGIYQIFYSSEIPKIVNVTQEKRVNRDIFGIYIGPLISIIEIITITFETLNHNMITQLDGCNTI